MYSRQKAIEYAYKWWNGRNPEYFNFDNYGGDCTNFISQCLYYGGIGMNYSHNGWYYTSPSSRSPSWTGVDEFFNFVTSNTSIYGVRGKIVSLDEILPGDIIQFNITGTDFHHSVIVTAVEGKTINDIYVTGHTTDCKNISIKSFNYKKIRFIKILN